VVPYADQILGELGLAVVCRLDHNDPPSIVELRTHGLQFIAKYKLPDLLVIVEELPLSSAQKIDRVAAFNMAEKQLAS
ncbi:MAG: hypothetical protein WD029_10145, partial [Microthrixaceae bacterium]